MKGRVGIYGDYRVVTFDSKIFVEECKLLGERVKEAGYEPDAILGIRNGGAYVAGNMFDDVPHLYCVLRRPSSSVKRGASGAVLKFLLRNTPRFICNRLRIREAKKLEKDFRRKCGERGEANILAGREERLELPDLSAYRHILVVDDAVDTGMTLAAVVSRVKRDYPKAEVRTAVVTVTAAKPVITPDYYLFDNHTLIRFPWSIDKR